MWTEDQVKSAVNNQKSYFSTGETLNVNFRIEALKKLKKAVIDHTSEMTQALNLDLGRSTAEAYFCDLGSVVLEINEIIRDLKKWARPEKHFSGLVCFPSLITKVYKMPYGVCLIISPFNFPFLLSLGVLAAAISGGNTAVIKASSKSPNCTKVLQKVVQSAFDEKYVTVIDGSHDVADLCLAQRFDKIFYTGSPSVAKHVMAEAAKNLTPVALELGGETGNWAVVRKDANIKDCARKIAFFKLCNSGQICININQVAVAEEIHEEFLEALKNEFVRQIGKEPLCSEEYPKLINRAAYNKCEAEAQEYKDRIIFGGSGDPETCKFSPTIVFPVGIDEKIVNHELFCPLLPVVLFKDSEVDSLISTINNREHGLALYLFTKNRRWAEKVMSTSQYGGGCVNEVCLHLMVKGAPFNGTGHSGMGAYHGQWGFREFTHPSTVLFGSTHFNLPLREHPYTGKSWKMKLLKLFEQ